MKGFLLPNYTQVPNILIDEIMRDMDGAELKVVLVAIRKTIGYHKISDAISLSQFEELTGLSRQGVLNGLEQAINRGVMRELDERGPRGVKLYTPVWIKEAEKVDQSTNLTSQESDQSNELTSELHNQSNELTSTSQLSLPTKESVKERKAEEKQHPTMQEADAAIFTAAAAVDGLPKVVLAYEQNIGVVTPMIRDKLIAAIDDYTEQWIIDAIDEAVSNNVRKWNYCNSILERWHNEGRKPKQTNGSAPTKTTGMDFSAKLAEMGITPDSPEYTETINRLMAEHYAERERRAQAMHAKQFEKVAS